jgi:CDP-glucose 4,6-dehydratase
MENMVEDGNFWAGRRVFLTGHTGFKGSWLCIWLHSLGAELYGYALKPPTEPSLFCMAGVRKLMTASTENDIRDLAALRSALVSAQPEVVFHMAAQPLVRDSYKDPVETYSINVMGTVNLFEALRSCPSVRAVASVTTDKVYENMEWVWGYRETDRLGGHDPYSNSKACTELVTAAFRSSYFNEKDYPKHGVAIATARAGNVIGGGDWAAERLVPDCVRAFTSHQKVKIRYPNSIRPWQHVLDALNGYMILAKSLAEAGTRFSGAWNFSPENRDARSVSWVVQTAAALWGGDAQYSIGTDENPHEAGLLMLDHSKARQLLGWKPRWNIEKALEKTVGWFKFSERGTNAFEICRSQITSFEAGE